MREALRENAEQILGILAITDSLLREAVERAIQRAAERRWQLFIAMRLQPTREVRSFETWFHSEAASFLGRSAGYAFACSRLGHRSGVEDPRPNFAVIDDPEIRSALERCFERSAAIEQMFFCGVAPMEGPHPFAWSARAALSDEIFAHLALCFRIAIVWSRALGAPAERPN